MKKIAILGATGSIGTQTLEVVRQHSDVLSVSVLTAGTNADLLIQQALEFCPDFVVIADESQYDRVCHALVGKPIKVLAGEQALCEVVQYPAIDTVVTAMVGFAGLRPTIAAIQAKKNIALANKETLVVAGEVITQLARENGVTILPVDSEHSAIFQCLVGEEGNQVEKILLTASGGPFRAHGIEQLNDVTAVEALKHPNWAMGAKITIDSATMMNKGLEMIEAKWLFDMAPEKIEILVHPESIIHSAVEFSDGSIKAQLATPNMCLPILYALSYPSRWAFKAERLNLLTAHTLHFEQPDFQKFPCLRLAYAAIEAGGLMPCVMNAANEVANLRFRQGEIAFMDIPKTIEKTMEAFTSSREVGLDTYFGIDEEARIYAAQLL